MLFRSKIEETFLK